MRGTSTIVLATLLIAGSFGAAGAVAAENVGSPSDVSTTAHHPCPPQEPLATACWCIHVTWCLEDLVETTDLHLS